MSRRTSLWLAIGAVLCGMTGCALRQPGYLTLTPSTPTIAHQGELRAFGAVSLNHLEGQIAGSPLPHLTLLANGYTGNGTRSYELGIGGYVRMGKNMLLDVSAFTTNARINNIDTMTTFSIFGPSREDGVVKAKYGGWALQTNISYGDFERKKSWKPTVSGGFKMHFVHYDHYSHMRGYESLTSGFVRAQSWTMPDYAKSERFYTVSLTGRAGNERVGFMLQVAYHDAIGRYKPGFIDNGPGYKFFWYTTGIEVFLGPHHRKNKSKTAIDNGEGISR